MYIAVNEASARGMGIMGVLPAQLGQADLATQCAVLQQGMERQLGEDAVRVQMGRSVTADEIREKSKSIALREQETPFGTIKYDFDEYKA